MKTTFRRLLALLATAVLGGAFSGALAAPVLQVGPEVALGEKAAPVPVLRLPVAKSDAPGVRLGPVSGGEMSWIRERNRNAARAKVLMIGVNRDVPATEENAGFGQALDWTPVAGGYAARVKAASPEALALRLGIDLRGVHPDVEMVFFGSGSGRLLGPVRVGAIADRFDIYWSPIMEGEAQTVEVFAPEGVNLAQAAVTVREVSHLFTDPGSGFSKFASDIGRSGSCNLDIACKASPSAAFLSMRNATAKLTFTKNGGTGLCSGTLMNDNDPSSQTPWFYTANHCFESEDPPLRTAAQMQTIANTVNTFWFFEAATCRSTATPAFVQRTGGSVHLYNNAVSDVLFLRLIDAPPAGAVFAGWNANLFPTGTAVTGVHHPFGDLKKYSEGATRGFATSPSYLVSTGGSFHDVGWTQGTTEGGSSGSGLFTFNGTNFEHRGGLAGGGASCASLTASDHYSRLDQSFTALQTYLAGSGPFTNFSDLWYNPAESGWGLSLVQHASGSLFGVWYTYDAQGKRLWVVMPGGAWSSSTTFTGNLYIVSGPPQNGVFNPALVKVGNPVGVGTLVFGTSDSGTWSYTINGVPGTKAIVRQPF